MITQQNPYTNYQLSAVGVGAIATGLDDIRQCIDIILRTIPGSDPLRPLFGSNIYRYLDNPTDVAVPNMKLEIYEALSIWEPRITVVSITHQVTTAQIEFNITYNINDSSILDVLAWSVNGIIDSGDRASGVILSAEIPIKLPGGIYNISFVTDGNPGFPTAPAYGFASAAELLAWVNENWFNYGTWYLAGSKLVLYLASGVAKRATLAITQKATLVKKSAVPSLSVGEFFNLALTVQGVNASPSFPTESINTLEQLLLWVYANWNAYGAWTIEIGDTIFYPGDFSQDFNNDIATGGVFTETYLVLQTELYTEATLTFI